jgi:hypothetical protein
MMNKRIQESDRELLELAAVAARIKLDLTLRPDGKPLGCSERGLAIDEAPGWWNPLISDADALRLAVKLRIGIGDREAVTAFHRQSMSIGSVYVEEFGDPIAATRRAIVRAAAEIGRTMR